MIVKLTDRQMGAIDFWSRRGYAVWSTIENSLIPLEDEDGEPTDEYGVSAGDDNETAQGLVDAYHEELDAGHDPFQGVDADLQVLARRIVDHMDYGLEYGFEPNDWE